jgi:hypothetical protein
MNQWISDYIRAQEAAMAAIPPDAVAEAVGKLRSTLVEDR